jgi:hypothetical protein
MKRAKTKVIENKIKENLEKNNMSQQELADRVNTNRSHISKIVNGKSPSISVAIALKIARELKTSVDELFIIEQ